jgi:hypothetical protein
MKYILIFLLAITAQTSFSQYRYKEQPFTLKGITLFASPEIYFSNYNNDQKYWMDQIDGFPFI